MHHKEFWLDDIDGNIVLIARNVAFRIYRGLLVAQSTVFADMFASSSPNSDEVIDGCPVIYVSDSPEDLAQLLRVLLPTTHRHFHPDDEMPERTFDEVFAIIRLAHKYHIEDVQRQALRLLREYTFNDNFEMWKGTREETIPVDGACAIGAVNLAKLLNVPEMILSAVYKCLSLRGGILDGWTCGDGSIEYLSQDDIKRCIDASHKLSLAGISLVSTMFRPEASNRCNLRPLCVTALPPTLLDVLKFHPEAVSVASQVMTPWDGIFKKLGGYGLCDTCWHELEARDTAGRQEIWKRFPDIFDVVAERWGNSV
ncbi:hypothetical protein LXA43DRAFT_881932 [Ganoderma leucocontextum]|nr:hypothetical protein LXA43DRAFT_881932 [Ganoderma leucocontextum]